MLADDEITSFPGAYLPDAGPAADAVVAQIGTETQGQPFLATLFWHAFVRTPEYRRSLDVLDVDATAQSERIVVVHGQNNQRYDLVVLVPGLTDMRSTTVEASRDSITTVIRRAPGIAETFGRFQHGQPTGRFGDSDSVLFLLSEAAAEVSDKDQFGLVVAPSPEVEPLSEVPDPAAAVEDSTGELLASIGFFERRKDGTAVATTALHAVGNLKTVKVGGATGKVTQRNAVTDSCLLSFESDPFGGSRASFMGPCRTRPPRQYIPVEFNGAGTKHLAASTLHGYDESILDPQPFIATKVYTEPDTLPGDSGASLIDPATGEALGFAVYRSSMSSAVTHSAWVWAEQVCTAHNI
jgi:hypothetical protein